MEKLKWFEKLIWKPYFATHCKPHNARKHSRNWKTRPSPWHRKLRCSNSRAAPSAPPSSRSGCGWRRSRRGRLFGSRPARPAARAVRTGPAGVDVVRLAHRRLRPARPCPSPRRWFLLDAVRPLETVSVLTDGDACGVAFGCGVGRVAFACTHARWFAQCRHLTSMFGGFAPLTSLLILRCS